MKSRAIAVLVVLAVALAATLYLTRTPQKPNIVLITVDTLRADHLGVYGSWDIGTPNIDQLASASTIFENAACPMPVTRPSIFSLFTSRYPMSHGALNNTSALPEEIQTLTQILKRLGYRTGAFIGMVLLGPDSGITRGFERVVVPRTEQVMVEAEQVVSKTLTWLNGLPAEENYFIWVHLFDPHQPYAPRPPFRKQLDPELSKSLPLIYWNNLLAIAAKNQGNIPANIFEHAKALYRGEVQYTDRWIGKLLEGLGDLDESLIILTADHGECFENGSYFEHSTCLQNGATRIPLLIRYPAVFARDHRVKNQAGIIDIAPTVLKILDQPVPETYAGQDLSQPQKLKDRQVLLQYPVFHPRITKWHQNLAEKIKSVAGEPTAPFRPDLRKHGLIDPAWKYLTDGAQEELYRLTPELDEKTNRAAAHPEVLEQMRQRLKNLAPAAPITEPDQEISKEQLERLRSLGYVQ